MSLICRKVLSPGTLLTLRLRPKIYSFSGAKLHAACFSKIKGTLGNRINIIPRRTFFGWFRKPKKHELKIKDNVPDQFNLIYQSRMDRYILYVQLFTTVPAFAVFLTTIISNDFSNHHLHFGHLERPPRKTDNEMYVYMAAFITFFVILQSMISRTPIRIYNLSQQKKYMFIFRGNYPFTYRKLTCHVGDVFKLPETGISPWKDVKYHIQNQQNVILLEHHFRRSADLYIMLGVQRDPDVDK